jgi:hypothetical protein
MAIFGTKEGPLGLPILEEMDHMGENHNALLNNRN